MTAFDPIDEGEWVQRGGVRVWRPFPKPPAHRVVDVHLCDCGCLLIYRNEACPSCLVRSQRKGMVA